MRFPVRFTSAVKAAARSRSVLTTVGDLLGLALIAFGVGLIFVPAAVIVAGVGVLAISIIGGTE